MRETRLPVVIGGERFRVHRTVPRSDINPLMLNDAVSERATRFKRLRVIWVTYDYPPAGGPGIWRALGMTKYLAQAGHDVVVVCSRRPNSAVFADKAGEVAVPPNVRVIRIASTRKSTAGSRITGLLGGLRRTTSAGSIPRFVLPDSRIHWAFSAATAVRRLAKKRGADCVVTSGPPHVGHIAGFVGVRGLPVKWVMDYRDLWTDCIYHRPKGRFWAGRFRQVENWMLRSCNAIAVVSPSWRRTLEGRLAGQQQNKIRLIPNGHDVPVEDCSPNRSEGALQIYFSGAIQPNNVCPELFEALCMLRDRKGPGDVELVFPYLLEHFRRNIALLGLQKMVREVGYVSHQENLVRCRGAEVVLLVVNSKNPVNVGVIPAKTYEYMALGKHVLAVLPEHSDVRRLLRDYPRATICSADDPEDIYQGLSKLLAARAAGALCCPPRISGAGTNNRGQYTRKLQAAQMEELLLNLVAESEFT